jgi:hypothetical protein
MRSDGIRRDRAMHVTEHRRAAKRQLDNLVVGIELTLISIVQGLALAVLAGAAVAPLLHWQWQTWPYVMTGIAVILIFWSRSLIHTLSFIGWPLEFGHTFGYLIATMFEAAALSEVADPKYWFALNTLYATCVWVLYAWDLRVVRRQETDFTTTGERALYADIVRDQLWNIRALMPAAIGFQCLSWWLVREYPAAMLERGWHLLLIGLSFVFSLFYLAGGVRLLHRRQDWILERAAQERQEG